MVRRASEAPLSLRLAPAVEEAGPRIRWYGGGTGWGTDLICFSFRAFRFARRCRGRCRGLLLCCAVAWRLLMGFPSGCRGGFKIHPLPFLRPKAFPFGEGGICAVNDG